MMHEGHSRPPTMVEKGGALLLIAVAICLALQLRIQLFQQLRIFLDRVLQDCCLLLCCIPILLFYCFG